MGVGVLIIDMQNDFCRPDGNLYVPGAEKDVEKLAGLLAGCSEKIEGILLSRDCHQVMDIGHVSFWKDEEGNHPEPYSVISLKSVKEGRWNPFVGREKVLVYLERLEAEKGKQLVVWPEHCIAGSEGAAIVDSLMEEVKKWAWKGHYFHLIEKGSYPLAEQYGIFRSEVVWEEVPSTWFNIPLLRELNKFDEIWIAGEARSHCVAATLEQLMDFPLLMSKLVIIEDCMSDVQGDAGKANSVYQRAGKMGARFVLSSQL